MSEIKKMEEWLDLRKAKSLRKKDETKVASIALFDEDGRLLFGKRRDNGKYSLPGGHFEPGETPEDAARRELKEETGYALIDDDFSFLCEGLGGPNDDIRVYVFEANVDFINGDPTADNDPDAEFEEFRWVATDEKLPDEIANNLHSPKNVTLRLLGLQEGTLKKGFVYDLPAIGTGIAPEVSVLDRGKVIRHDNDQTVYDCSHRLTEKQVDSGFFLEIVEMPKAIAAYLLHDGVHVGRIFLYLDVDRPGVATLGLQDLNNVTPTMHGRIYKALFWHARNITRLIDVGQTQSPYIADLWDSVDESIKKSFREKLTALAGVAAMATSPAPLAIPPPPVAHTLAQPAPKVEAPSQVPVDNPWHPGGLTDELKPIAHLESQYGKQMIHKAHSLGPFHTAWGACGLKPVTAAEEYQRQPHLKALFPGLEDESKFLDEFKTNHTFYNLIASAHWARLKRATGSPEKAAYAWRWGRGAAAQADDAAIQADPYVQAFTKLRTKLGPTAASGSAANQLVMKSRFETYVNDWLAKADGDSFDHYSTKQGLKVLDPKFQGTGAVGEEKYRPKRPPRVYLYEAGAKPEAQVAAGGFKYRAELPSNLKLYDFSTDEHKLMKPRVTKTPRGTMVDPPDLDAVERKLIKLGYHGYRGYSSAAPNAVAIFGKVPVKGIA